MRGRGHRICSAPFPISGPADFMISMFRRFSEFLDRPHLLRADGGVLRRLGHQQRPVPHDGAAELGRQGRRPDASRSRPSRPNSSAPWRRRRATSRPARKPSAALRRQVGQQTLRADGRAGGARGGAEQPAHRHPGRCRRRGGPLDAGLPGPRRPVQQGRSSTPCCATTATPRPASSPQLRADIAQRQLLNSVSAGVQAPAAEVKPLYESEFEKRAADMALSSRCPRRRSRRRRTRPRCSAGTTTTRTATPRPSFAASRRSNCRRNPSPPTSPSPTTNCMPPMTSTNPNT